MQTTEKRKAFTATVSGLSNIDSKELCDAIARLLELYAHGQYSVSTVTVRDAYITDGNLLDKRDY